MAEATKIFVSYSHDSPEHRAWVLGLATFLRDNGLDVKLDQWHLEWGSDLAAFMESITTSDRVLIIVTDEYIAKAEAGKGGAGYEKTIAAAEILRGIPREKYIPIIRSVAGEKKVPTFLGSQFWADFQGENDNDRQREKLLRCLHGVGPPRPEIGRNPFEESLSAGESDGPSAGSKESSVDGDASIAVFNERFRSTFAGLRNGCRWSGTRTYNDKSLVNFMRAPLKVADGTPIWWWRGQGAGIFRFEPVVERHISSYSWVREAEKMLMNNKELIIEHWAGCNVGNPDRNFLYIMTDASSPVGGGWGAELMRAREEGGYIEEEFGLVDLKQKITKALYEDMLMDVPGEKPANLEARSHFITKYNFLIIPEGSIIRDEKYGPQIEEVMRTMLRKKAGLDTLMQVIKALPD